jgi:hypothetical protein
VAAARRLACRSADEECHEPARPVDALHHDLTDVRGLRRARVQPEGGRQVVGDGAQGIAERGQDSDLFENDHVRRREKLRTTPVACVQQQRAGLGDPRPPCRNRHIGVRGVDAGPVGHEVGRHATADRDRPGVRAEGSQPGRRSGGIGDSGDLASGGGEVLDEHVDRSRHPVGACLRITDRRPAFEVAGMRERPPSAVGAADPLQDAVTHLAATGHSIPSRQSCRKLLGLGLGASRS